MGVNGFALVSQLIVLIVLLGGFLLPIILGFAVVLPDANRHGQPGILWAVLTIPLNWLAILAYLVVRAISPRPGSQG